MTQSEKPSAGSTDLSENPATEAKSLELVSFNTLFMEEAVKAQLMVGQEANTNFMLSKILRKIVSIENNTQLIMKCGKK